MLRVRKLSRGSLFIWLLGLLSAVAIISYYAPSAGSTVTVVTQQITSDNQMNIYPRIDGNNIVWRAADGDGRVFLYDGSTTVQLADNSLYGEPPEVSGNNVVWQGYVSGSNEIILYDGSAVTALTSNGRPSVNPKISGNNVVWYGYGGDDQDLEIFFYNGSSVTTLTDNSFHDMYPRVSGNNVVWYGYDGADSEIFYYDGSSITTLTSNIYEDTNPRISGDNVVWMGDDGNDNEIFFYDGSTITQLTNNIYEDQNPQISGNNVVWHGASSTSPNHDIFMYDGSRIRRLTNNAHPDWGVHVSGNNVVWGASHYPDFGPQNEIFYYDGQSVTRLTENSVQDHNPQISGNKVTWSRGGATSDIFMATVSSDFSPPVFNDSSPPTDPTISSPSHSVGPSSHDNTIDLDIHPDAIDTSSGVDGYSISFSKDTTEVPPRLICTTDTPNTTDTYTSAALGGGEWYANLSTVDNAGNWTSTVHIGPFTIVDPPTNPTSATELGGAQDDIWQGSVSDPEFTWTGASDRSGSGIAGYYYYWGTSPSGSPTTWTTSSAYDPPLVSSPAIYYLRVRTEDNVGRQSSAATIFAFKYDADTPVDPSVTGSNPGVDTWTNDNTIEVSFAGATDTVSGVDGFSVQWSGGATDLPDTTKDLEETESSTTSSVLADGAQYFHLRTADNAGNWTSTVHAGPFKVDTIKPTGIIKINNVATLTEVTDVTLNLSGSDTGGSGLDKMRIMDDGSAWPEWGAYSTTKNWTLPIGDGTKKVWVQFKDKAGNESAAYSDTIVLDIPQPVGSDIAHIFVSQWGGTGSGNGSFDKPGGITVDSVGNVYVADTENHRIQKFSANGTYISSWGGTQGTADGQFAYPEGVAVDSAGNIYVADTFNDRIQKLSPAGAFLTKWGVGGSGNGEFVDPWGLAVDKNNNIYVADTHNDRIQKFDSNGGYLSQWGGTGSGNGEFNAPEGIAIDSAGNVYVADTENHRIQKFSANGTYISSWGGTQGTADGQLYRPQGVAVNSIGNIYVVDSWNDRIQKFSPDGAFLVKWGVYGSGNGEFLTPGGVAVDKNNNVYVADTYNDRVQKFQPAPPATPAPPPAPILDTQKPITRMVTPFVSTRISKTTTFKVKWSATDAAYSAGIKSYTVRYRPSTSSSWRNWKTNTTAKEGLFKGKGGVTYYFRTVTTDNAGNKGWSKVYKTIVPFNEGIFLRKIGFFGYQKLGRSQNYLSSVRYSYKRGHTLVYKLYRNNGIGLVVTKGPKMGRAKIYVDGKFVRTVDAHSSKVRPRQLIFYKGFKKKGTHYLKVVNLGTPGRARFEVDGVVVGR